jgi:hypothetical protein
MREEEMMSEMKQHLSEVGPLERGTHFVVGTFSRGNLSAVFQPTGEDMGALVTKVEEDGETVKALIPPSAWVEMLHNAAAMGAMLEAMDALEKLGPGFTEGLGLTMAPADGRHPPIRLTLLEMFRLMYWFMVSDRETYGGEGTEGGLESLVEVLGEMGLTKEDVVWESRS